MPQVCRNFTNCVAIELRRTKNNVHAVVTCEDQVRRVRVIPNEVFDRDWKELMKGIEPYPLDLAIEKWLKSHEDRFIQLAEPAEKEMRAMLVLLKKDASAIMSVEQDDSKLSELQELMGKKALIMANQKDMLELEDASLIKLFNLCYPKHAIEAFKDKKKVVKAIWEYIEKEKEALQMQHMAESTKKGGPAKTMSKEIPGVKGAKPGREGTPGKEGATKEKAAAPEKAKQKMVAGQPVPEKGSQEAKDKMAALRAKSGKGGEKSPHFSADDTRKFKAIWDGTGQAGSLRMQMFDVMRTKAYAEKGITIATLAEKIGQDAKNVGGAMKVLLNYAGGARVAIVEK